MHIYTENAANEDLDCTFLYMAAPVPATRCAICLVHADRRQLPELRKEAGCGSGRPFRSDTLGTGLAGQTLYYKVRCY